MDELDDLVELSSIEALALLLSRSSPAVNVAAKAILLGAVAAERERCCSYIENHQTVIAGQPADPILEEVLHALRQGAEE